MVDNRVGTRKYDYFTYSNIRGRSGRMSEHFVGRVVVFNPQPRRTDLVVDVPVLSQPANTSLEILIQLPEDELTPENAERLRPFIEQTVVGIDTLRLNKGLSPNRQLNAANELADDPDRWSRGLTWKGAFPSASQVREMGVLLFTLTGSGNAVRSAAQLAARMNIVRHHRGNVHSLARDQIARRNLSADEAVEDALDFSRYLV